MDNVYCLACGSGYASRPQDGPMKLYACVRCIGNKEALECSDCGLRFRGVLGKSVCQRCLENRLAEKGIWPGRWKDPIEYGGDRTEVGRISHLPGPMGTDALGKRSPQCAPAMPPETLSEFRAHPEGPREVDFDGSGDDVSRWGGREV